MTTRKRIHERSGTFFITFTCKDWLPLIEICQGYDIVYDWFNILKSNGHYINAYVIMPNHIHLLITFINSSFTINSVIGNGKRFMAYRLVDRLKYANENKLLRTLKDSVEPIRKINNKLHDIWRYSFDCKNCFTNRFRYQKLNYIHANPCKGKWKLADSPESYPHCSAYFYATGKQGHYAVDHIERMRKVSLTDPQRPSPAANRR